MQQFKYTAKSASGSTIKGSVNALTPADATAQLQKQSMVVLTLKPATGPRWNTSLFGGTPKPRPGSEDMVLFTRQLATMIGAGIPLLEALEVQAEQVTDKGFRIAIQRIVAKVRGGSDLSAALGEYPKVFKPIYLNMIRAGEASGQLDEILLRLAKYQEASVALRREIKAAMTYPVISLALITGITLFLMVGILPKFKTIFDNLMASNPNASLPWITEFMLGLSLVMRDNFLIGLLAFGRPYHRLHLLRPHQTRRVAVALGPVTCSGVRIALQEGGDVEVQSNLCDAHTFGSAHTGCVGNRRRDRRKPNRGGCRRQGTRKRQTGQHAIGATGGKRGIPADGHSNDIYR